MSNLNVYYPLGGHRALLHWWTYEERGHVVLANSEKSVAQTAKVIFDEYGSVELRDYCEIQVIGPPRRMLEAARGYDKREAVTLFHQTMVQRMHEVVKSGRRLPLPFAECLKYEVHPEMEVVEDDWTRESHYCCLHCREKIRILEMTPLELYERYHAEWYKYHPVKDYADPKRVPSRAPPAYDSEELWFAYAVFGHHASGIVLNPVDYNLIDESALRPDFLSDHVLFYFRRGRDLDRTALQTYLDSFNTSRADRQARQEARRIEDRKRENEQEVLDTLSFFEANGAP